MMKSLFGDLPCNGSIPPPSYISFTTASVSAVICVVTIVGNILVVLAIFIDPNRDLKSPFNYFVANLAVTDLVVGIVVEPIAVGIHISEGVTNRHEIPVEVLHLPFFISCTASVLSLSALTWDRFVAITSPISYRTLLNPKRAVFIALAIWLFSLSFPFVYLKTGYIPYSFVFIHTVVVTTFVIMAITYVKIFRVFKKQVKLWDCMDVATEETNAPKIQALKWEQKVSKTFLIMLGFFLASYLPACVFVYIINFCYACSCNVIEWSRDAVFVLILANSGVNPFVYAWRFENFRKAFVKLLTCGACRLSGGRRNSF